MMGKVTLNAELRAKLNGLNQPMELYDESGELVAVCLPPEDYRQLTGIPPEADFTDAEVQAAMLEVGRGRQLVDIWKDLGRT
ncbi:MAG TPA: hypothetical protein VGL71_01900 [Urbifossiella sp.]|jgi:hypothetical protein